MAGRHVRDQWTSYVCAKNSGRFRREQHHILCPILAQLSWQQIFCQRDTWKRKDTTKSIVTRAICVANYTSLNFGRKIEMIAAFRVCMRYALRIRLLDVHATFVEYFFSSIPWTFATAILDAWLWCTCIVENLFGYWSNHVSMQSRRQNQRILEVRIVKRVIWALIRWCQNIQ